MHGSLLGIRVAKKSPGSFGPRHRGSQQQGRQLQGGLLAKADAPPRTSFLKETLTPMPTGQFAEILSARLWAHQASCNQSTGSSTFSNGGRLFCANSTQRLSRSQLISPRIRRWWNWPSKVMRMSGRSPHRRAVWSLVGRISSRFAIGNGALSQRRRRILANARASTRLESC